uniref:Kinesin motor domain-containing protein n=1 Tax=Graphocephala atropunctata TaxID=36148 RepID=A0A1B6KLE4_9HEMI
MASKNGKPQNTTEMIQAYIRVRPLYSHEEKSPLLEFSRNEVTIKDESGRLLKTLTFDKVFSESASQRRVYDTVVGPMINEILQGYNCTVFAYGQTGTGKTYTMTGDCEAQGENAIQAGIIPRAMDDIFQALQNISCEYQVKISYLELYNEKMKSLLHYYDHDFDIQLMDDMDGNVVLKGLTPIPVNSKEQALKLLKVGMEKKQTASTKMNINSSRSHTVFTITVTLKETEAADDDDVLRIGKLHLVDLAGSENASKSGASEAIGGVKKRLNEMSNINRSLLTLGRVITCIAENNPHIPYRESKLTRFLKDSLGGKTKTCVVGTISPTNSCLDETENTLNYANKVRLIKNKPEKNEKVSKKECMQMAADELMNLKRDLEAARLQEGVFVSNESYADMRKQIDILIGQNACIAEKYNILVGEYNKTMEMFNSFKADYDDKLADIEDLKSTLYWEDQYFNEKQQQWVKEMDIREHLLSMLKEKESKLTEEAKKSTIVLADLCEQNVILHDKVERQRNLELDNLKALDHFKAEVAEKLQNKFMGRLNSNFKEKSEDCLKLGQTTKHMMEEIKGKHQVIEEKLWKIKKIITQHIMDTSDCTTVLEKDTRDNLYHIVPYIDECVKIIEDSVRGNMRSLIKPNIDVIKRTLLSLGTSALRTLEYLRKCELKKNLMIKEIEINSKNFEETKILFEDQLQILQENVEEAMKKVREVNIIAKFAVKKVEPLKVAAADVEKYTRKTLEASVEARTTMEPISENINSLKSYIQKSLESHKVCEGETFQNIIEQEELSLEFRTDLGNQMNEKKKDLVQDTIDVYGTLKGSIKRCLRPVNNPIPVVEGRINTAVMGTELYTDHLQCQDEELIVSVTNVVNEMVTEVNDYKDLCKDNLKNGRTDDSPSQADQITAHRQEIGQTLADIKRDVKQLNYVKDVPTGRTPPRVMKNDFNYPQQLMPKDTEDLYPSSTALSQMADLHLSTLSMASSVGDDEGECAQLKPSLKRSLSLPEVGAAASTPTNSFSRRENTTQSKMIKKPNVRRNVKPRKPQK